jgi:hypothetical protein
MALSERATVLIAHLSKAGDIFARHIKSKALPRDAQLLASLARRGDLMAQRHIKGTSASLDAKALVNRLALQGDIVSQGLNEMSTDVLAQVITFAQPADQELIDAGAPDGILAETITLTATSDSGLPVSFVVVSGPATVSGSALTITNEGSVVIEARQAGDPNYTAATPVQRTITVTIAA